MTRMSSGSSILDEYLLGGYEHDIITTIYGPAGSGKTLFCLLAMISAVKSGKKAIFVDTEGGYCVERLQQLDSDSRILENSFVLKPTNFEEQRTQFEKLKQLISKDIGIIIIDSISMLYRIELGKSEQVYETNKQLGLQLSFLSEITRKHNIPVLITNQVYADFENKDRVKMVGGDLLKYTSKCLIELKKFKSFRKAVLIKHRSIKEGKELDFDICNEGITSKPVQSSAI